MTEFITVLKIKVYDNSLKLCYTIFSRRFIKLSILELKNLNASLNLRSLMKLQKEKKEEIV